MKSSRREFIAGAGPMVAASAMQGVAAANEQKKPGKIVFISSVVGFFTTEFSGAYSASKHAIEAVAEALHAESLWYQGGDDQPWPAPHRLQRPDDGNPSALVRPEPACHRPQQACLPPTTSSTRVRLSTAWRRSLSRAAESSGTSFRISSPASSSSRPMPGMRPSKSRRAPVLCSTDLHFNQEETSMIKSSIFSAAVTAVSAVSLAGAANAQPAHNTSDGKPVKNVVLVHGAFADGSGWRGVYDELTQPRLPRHHRAEPAHLACRRRRRDEARAGSPGRPDHPRRPLLGRHRHHRSGHPPERCRPCLRLRPLARCWRNDGPTV